MPTMYLSDLRKDYPGLNDKDIASKIGQKYGYRVIVRYKHPSSKEYDLLGCCANESQAAGYLNNPNCKNPQVIYGPDMRSCSVCGRIFAATAITPQVIVGQILVDCGLQCRQCGTRFCINCAPRNSSNAWVCNCGENLAPYGM